MGEEAGLSEETAVLMLIVQEKVPGFGGSSKGRAADDPRELGENISCSSLGGSILYLRLSASWIPQV